jgi:DNA-binding FadR family transcriptional regulator
MKISLNIIDIIVTSYLETLYSAPDRRKKIVEHHTAMLNGILTGNGEAARSAVRDHLDFVKTEIQKADIQHQREQRLSKTIHTVK